MSSNYAEMYLKSKQTSYLGRNEKSYYLQSPKT